MFSLDNKLFNLFTFLAKMYLSKLIQNYKVLNSLFILGLFVIPSLVFLKSETSPYIVAFVISIGLSLLFGWLLPFSTRINLQTDEMRIKKILFFTWMSINLVFIAKVIAIGLPSENHFGRDYELTFMRAFPLLTKLYLFGPIISASLFILEENKTKQSIYFLISSIVIFFPGIKGSIFLFLFIIIYCSILDSRNIKNLLSLYFLIIPPLTIFIFFVSIYLRFASFEKIYFVNIVSIIYAYFQPNFVNLSLMIENYSDLKYGSFLLNSPVRALTFGTVNLLTEPIDWHFISPDLKAGTFARSFWIDWGWAAPFFTFCLGAFYNFVCSIFEGSQKINKILISIMSFPFGFIFFYNEFFRNQIIFGALLLFAIYVFCSYRER